MADIFCEWPSADATSNNGDLLEGPDGDILFCDGATEARQRVTRRCLSNDRLPLGPAIFSQADVEYDPPFGVGLRRDIGDVQNSAKAESIRQKIRDGMSKDGDIIATSPPPYAIVTPGQNGPLVVAVFTPISTGKPQSVPLSNLT